MWARETAGLTVDEAAEKLGLKDLARATARQKLQELENGQRDPAPTTLQKAASIYRRPLVAFYMSQPPARGDRGEDFRAAKSASAQDNATLDALLRDVRARQQMVREVLEDAEEFSPAHSLVALASRMGRKPWQLRSGLRLASQKNSKGEAETSERCSRSFVLRPSGSAFMSSSSVTLVRIIQTLARTYSAASRWRMTWHPSSSSMTTTQQSPVRSP